MESKYQHLRTYKLKQSSITTKIRLILLTFYFLIQIGAYYCMHKSLIKGVLEMELKYQHLRTYGRIDKVDYRVALPLKFDQSYFLIQIGASYCIHKSLIKRVLEMEFKQKVCINSNEGQLWPFKTAKLFDYLNNEQNEIEKIFFLSEAFL